VGDQLKVHTGGDMTATDTRVGQPRETLAQRFSAYRQAATNPSDLGILIRSFDLSLRAMNGSPKTVKSYTDTTKGLCLFLVDNGMPTDVQHLTREHVETYMAFQVEHFRPKPAQIRFGDLQQFFRWAVEEREMSSSPMANMKRPLVPEEPPPVLTGEQLRLLLKAEAALRIFDYFGWPEPRTDTGGNMLADAPTEKEVLDTLGRFITGYEGGDIDAVVDTLVPDADLVLLGTAADERRIGIEGARSQFERDISQSESRSLQIGWSSISAAGDVAWLAAELTVTAVADGESVTFPVRLTAVFEQRDGTWKIAQAHLSVPDSSTSEGQSFPT
jgi:ketosteroid isomerase-like protein